MRIAKLVAARSLAALSIVVAAGAATVWGCGGGSSNDSKLPAGYYITISNMTFSPANLVVPPGATVNVLASVDHSVTSETAPGDFTPGAVGVVSFDTGIFVGQRSFVIPSTAPDGTVIPYYCRNHLGSMTPQNGTITVRVGAAPNPPPGDGKGGGY